MKLIRLRMWFGTPKGALVYFGVGYTLIFAVLFVMLTGCVNYRDRESYSRGEIDAINAEAACKAAARNLVQIARCEIRR